MTVSISGTSGITFPDGSLQTAAASPLVLRNRIINGDMRIDQRNASASVTITTDSTYTLDRYMCEVSQASKFSVQQNAASVTPPTGFTNYLGVTSLSSYSVVASDYFTVMQKIEGYNVADLDFGKATAKTITISFWVRSSLTGTFGGSIGNSAENRSYPFSYTISVANTWEQKTITIAGDTTGTWLTTNGRGLNVRFSLGMGSTFSATAGAWTTTANIYSATGATSVVGTNGATFYITGVQLEQNTSATPFERRLYNQELANCQRYFETSYFGVAVPTNTNANYVTIGLGTQTYASAAGSAKQIAGDVTFKVTKRAAPTMKIYSYTSSTLTAVSKGYTGTDLAANSGDLANASVNTFSVFNSTGGNITTDGYSILFHYSASAEL